MPARDNAVSRARFEFRRRDRFVLSLDRDVVRGRDPIAAADVRGSAPAESVCGRGAGAGARSRVPKRAPTRTSPWPGCTAGCGYSPGTCATTARGGRSHLSGATAAAAAAADRSRSLILPAAPAPSFDAYP
ncbi:hypothetical protein PSD17_01580 [Pseudonocardia sp. D17]|nr:hypothetical protein PSD17_01580 [Pseudonocardia sp. D17]